jgi:hypothetical protein
MYGWIRDLYDVLTFIKKLFLNIKLFILISISSNTFSGAHCFLHTLPWSAHGQARWHSVKVAADAGSFELCRVYLAQV